MFIVRRCINTSAGVKCRQPKNGKTEPSDLIVNGRTILYGSDDLKNIVTMQSAQQRTEIPIRFPFGSRRTRSVVLAVYD